MTTTRHLSTAARFASAAVLAGLLSACANVHHVEVGSVPDDYRTNHPIIVSEQEQTLDIPVASGDRELTIASRGAVRGHAQRYKASASGSVRIMTPAGSMNSGAASILAQQVREELVKQGIPQGRILTTPYHASASGDAAPIRVSYFAIDATTGECGRWPEDMLANGNENKHYANFGCASQNNLAAMVADPMDLIAPRGSTPIDAGRREQVLRDYQSEGAGL
ncbi:CpaD family pilus assembly protein [Pararhizobium haloflavum]|uniref:CpaD family pilus assembly protein n=1 Tax=Pararhizobium haloflavum TaxID=2037914 RepID=UPI001FE0704A|nr:CpaD family pilus assembly lipoprotein [Pararhizobium haloflavum]